jgi:hypothetical protein
MMAEVRDTLNERGGRYGRFDAHAMLAEQLIRVAQFHPHKFEERKGWLKMAADQRHAIRYILDKIARILEGDPDYIDNWHDIAGYATLIEDRLNGTGLYAKYVEPTDTLISDPSGREPDRCVECHAIVGDVHAPDCPQRTHVSPTR